MSSTGLQRFRFHVAQFLGVVLIVDALSSHTPAVWGHIPNSLAHTLTAVLGVAFLVQSIYLRKQPSAQAK